MELMLHMNVTLLQNFTTLEMNKTLNIMEHLYKSGKAMQKVTKSYLLLQTCHLTRLF